MEMLPVLRRRYAGGPKMSKQVTKSVAQAGRRRTIWLLKRKGEVNGGVRSTIPNCGYDPETLKSIMSKGYRIKEVEE